MVSENYADILITLYHITALPPATIRLEATWSLLFLYPQCLVQDMEYSNYLSTICQINEPGLKLLSWERESNQVNIQYLNNITPE